MELPTPRPRQSLTGRFRFRSNCRTARLGFGRAPPGRVAQLVLPRARCRRTIIPWAESRDREGTRRRDAGGNPAAPGLLVILIPRETRGWIIVTLNHALDLIGVAVFAVSGALAAGRKQLDLLGVVVLGLVTAVGGGTIRDVLLDRHPIFWLADPTYVVVIVAAALITVAYVRWRPPPAATLLYADAVGLAMFSLTGAQIAERAGLPPIACIVLGTITGAAGGAVRDILSAEIPLVLRRGNLYASAAILGTSCYFGLLALGTNRPLATWGGMLVVAAVRLASIAFGLQLPVFALEGDGIPTRRDR